MKFTRDEKVDTLLITISAISVIASFILSLDYIAWIAVLACGIPIFKESIKGLKELDIKADVLVSIAIIASIIIGEVFAAGEIATIMAIGGFLEEYTVKKTQQKIKDLVNITPQVATRVKNGVEEEISVENVQVGDILKILPGKIIPTDGIIVTGETSIDQSTLTGESLPVDKKVNDEVYSGTINLYGSFTMKTTKVSKDSSIQKLVKLVKSSSPENAEIVRSADKWATIIVVIAFTAAILTYLFTFEIIRSVTILVVFCPCALVLATPTAIMAAIGNLTKYGILVKDGQSLEQLARIDEIIFDKTGTLTTGKPEVTDALSDNPNETMYLLASLESKSEHPLAKAILKNYAGRLAEVDDFKIKIGKGISGKINGSKILAGKREYLKENNISLKYAKQPAHGESEIFVVKENEVIGKVLVADSLRKNVKDTIWSLKGLRVRTTLLTGDNEDTANHIAQKLKIRNVRANCLPEDKLGYITQEQIKGNYVAMIGDGINDAPSLQKANVGIAMGGIGSDISVEASDVTLVNDNVNDIPHLIRIARKTIRTINVGIAFALGINIIAMCLAIFGILTPIEGALVHNIGSVIVITYSSTLFNYKSPKKNLKKSKKLGTPKHLNNSMT